MPRTATKTQVSTRTKVLVGFAAGGLAIAAGLGYFGSTRTSSFPSLSSLVTEKVYTYPEKQVPKNKLLLTHVPLADDLKRLPEMQKNPGGTRMVLYRVKAAPVKDPSVYGNVRIKQFSIKLILPKNALVGQFGITRRTNNLTQELPTGFQDLYTVQAFKLPNPDSVLFPNIFKNSFSFIGPFADNDEYLVVFTFQDELKISSFGDELTINGKVLLKDPTGDEKIQAKLYISNALLDNGWLVNNRRTSEYPSSPSILHIMRINPLDDPQPTNWKGPYLYQKHYYLFPGNFIYSDGSAQNHNTSLGNSGGSADWFLLGTPYPEEFPFEEFIYKLSKPLSTDEAHL
ncbi:MAG: hypothetical protein NUV81_00625 [bacterium]|nr:hypothetical protein [bacterium]